MFLTISEILYFSRENKLNEDNCEMITNSVINDINFIKRTSVNEIHKQFQKWDLKKIYIHQKINNF